MSEKVIKPKRLSRLAAIKRLFSGNDVRWYFKAGLGTLPVWGSVMIATDVVPLVGSLDNYALAVFLGIYASRIAAFRRYPDAVVNPDIKWEDAKQQLLSNPAESAALRLTARFWPVLIPAHMVTDFAGIMADHYFIGNLAAGIVAYRIGMYQFRAPMDDTHNQQ